MTDMVTCPSCGDTVDNSQDFCRNCGESVEEIEQVSGDEIRIHLKDQEVPLKCNRADYNQQGEWIKAQMKDGSSRLYPRDRIEYIEAPNPLDKLTSLNLNEEIPKLEMKEVSTWSSTARFLNSITGGDS